MLLVSRILHSLSLDTVGGVESVFGDYLRHPESAAHEHHLMILNRRCHPFFKEAVQKRTTTTFHAKYAGPLRLPRSLRPCWSAHHAARLKPDIQIIYNTLDNPSAWAAAPHATTRIYYERGAAWWSIADRATVSRHIELTHHFFCNSNAARRILEIRYGVESSRCDVIYNPMRLAPFTLVDQATINKSPRFRIGMAGRLIAVKGMVIGLHALALLLKKSPNFELVIAGVGPEQSMLQDVSRRLGLERSISFLGVVSDMRAFYTSLDVFACPSLREPLGNVAIEANGCGCPVICTEVDGLPEAIVPNRTGFCIHPVLTQAEYQSLGVAEKALPELVYDPVSDSLVTPRAISPDQLADAIWQLAQSPEQRATLAQDAVLMSRQRFSMEGYIQKFHALLTERR